jgi:hypothetical protein
MSQKKIPDPAFALNGVQPKRWKTQNGVLVLEKSATADFLYQEPFNDKIGGVVADRLGIDHVRYDVCYKNGKPYSYCENFLDENTEFITAAFILRTRKRQNNQSAWQHYLACCEGAGIPLKMASDAFAKYEIVDSVIANPDRHPYQFGFIRNANDLVWEKACPIFDCANSLWADKEMDERLHTFVEGDPKLAAARGDRTFDLIKDPDCYPFHNSHEGQIKALGDVRDLVDLNKLDGIEDEVEDILKDSEPLQQNPKRLALTLRGIKRRKDITKDAMEQK